ncbi:hypothetical protein NDU88_006357 [Pleurodeles waltl]|uniref:Uncharacterized protein n=1 Tax=Pleurodeles waltl TaxID=8319 RepID=A0AAV7RRN0_PLEWA|nr:hypothetical protein NDU88_006357 [Pleurodeles waltl]
MCVWCYVPNLGLGEVEIPATLRVHAAVTPLPSQPCLSCDIRPVPLDNFHTSEPLRVSRRRTAEMRSYSGAAPHRVPRSIYRVDLSVGAYCARPPMSVSPTGFSAFNGRGSISPPSFL